MVQLRKSNGKESAAVLGQRFWQTQTNFPASLPDKTDGTLFYFNKYALGRKGKRMRTGIFGGTFDPVHNGHIACAREIMKQMHFDRMLFIPTGEPPHKICRRITPAKDRLAMLSEAIRHDEKFFVSDIECRRPDYTYTYDTLTALRQEAKDGEEFYLIVGADTLADLVHWHRAEEVFRLCTFVAMRRPGYNEAVFRRGLERVTEAGAKVCAADVPQMNISSTQIREAAAAGEPLESFVPAEVACYIRRHGIYRTRIPELAEIYEDLRKLLGEKRFTHSVSVMEESVRLAKQFGADTEKCRLAGLLHDCAKELTPQQYRWMGLEMEASEAYDGKEVLLHGEAGAILAKSRYGIEDPEILEAIRCHITGRPGMGLVAQIVFVADYTEANRQGAFFDAVRDEIKAGSLDGAILRECNNTIQYILSRGDAQLCLESVRTRNWIVRKINGKAEQHG